MEGDFTLFKMNELRVDLPFTAMLFSILHYHDITSSLPNPTILCPIQPTIRLSYS